MSNSKVWAVTLQISATDFKTVFVKANGLQDAHEMAMQLEKKGVVVSARPVASPARNLKLFNLDGKHERTVVTTAITNQECVNAIAMAGLNPLEYTWKFDESHPLQPSAI
jgi:hypothetical protein